MVYEVRRSKESELDLDLIFDHLVEVHVELGDLPRDAFAQAAARVRKIQDDIFAIGRIPHQGTLSPELAPGLRHVTKDRAIIYFGVDDTRRLVSVIAVFFGGQDHHSHILRRLGVVEKHDTP